MSSALSRRDRAPVLLMAMGNRWRGDDGVGPAVLDLLTADILGCRRVRVTDRVGDAMSILNDWDGVRHVLIVDAAVTGAKPGTIYRFDISDQPIAHESSAFSGHGMGLAEAIELGKALDRLPQRISGWAVEAEQFSDGAPLSDAVRNATSIVARQVRARLADELNLE